MSLKKMHDEYEALFTDSYKKYIDLHKELDAYRGIELTDEIVLKVNPIILKIQEAFEEIHPYIHTTMHRYQFCSRAMQDYNEFIDHIKQGGAVKEDEAAA